MILKNLYLKLCGPKADETEMGAALFTKNGEGRNFDIFDFFGLMAGISSKKISGER